MCSLLGYGYGVEQSKPSPNSICFSIFSILASILCSVNLDDISCESVRVWVQAMEWSKCSSSHCAAVTFLGTVSSWVYGFLQASTDAFVTASPDTPIDNAASYRRALAMLNLYSWLNLVLRFLTVSGIVV
ncbi:Os06g0139176 [Oryza sativa Japonica Group]|uniref:Os06g0138951 protein n=1 Tax=Oryza sativa subsp. japonica TaxID=39947 RepID=A0A0P0WSQ9_ORYSJ|nr:Os06g0138951 [Oryza sativa Japonica Group]BAS96064.1 Os06g0139176 [Oryza sativa Japonica Group]